MDRSVEEKWQKRWQDSHLFEPLQDESKPKFMITVPWPYTNGPLHVGHGRTYTLADIIARFRRMRGFNVLFPMAFHQSGTPILAFSERIRLGDEKTINQYRDNLMEYEEPENIDSIMESFKKPENIASYFSDRIVKDFNSLGYSIDWTRRFTSADPFYQDFVKWQFERLRSKGLIKSGKYPVLYSVDDANAVGEDDISDGDIDKVTIEEYTAVAFRGDEYSLLAASLRPETLFGVTNLWISDHGDYVIVKVEGEKYAVSAEAAQKIILQHEGSAIISQVSSDDIISRKFTAPFTQSRLTVYRASFVDPDNGTGVVYSVPGHAVWDYVAIKQYGVPATPVKVISVQGGEGLTVESLVTEAGLSDLSDSGKIKDATQRLYREEFYSGRMNDSNGPFSGMTVQQAREAMRQELISSRLGFIFYEVSRKAQTRGGSKVVVAVLNDQWFIDYSVEWWKQESHDLIRRMYYYPEFYRNAMHEAVDWLRERPCARRRGLGTRLPFNSEWVIESLSDSTIYPAVYTNAAEMKRIHEILGKLPEEIVEYIYGSGTDESVSHYGEEVVLLAQSARRNLHYWYGVDIRLTAHPHLSNHLSFYVMNHAALFPKELQPRGLIITGLVVSNGAKISKSKGNAISLLKIATRYSADLYRLFVAVNADMSSTLDWNESEINAVRKRYETFLELMGQAGRQDRFVPTQVEKWFLSRFNQHMKEYIERMEGNDLRGAIISIFYEVINDLRYLENRGGNLPYSISSVSELWVRAMAPVIPHTCEELWEKAGKTGFVSVEQILDGDIGEIDESALAAERYLQKLVQDIRDIIKATKIDPASIGISVCSGEMRKLAQMLMEDRVSEATPRLKPFIGDFMKNRKNIDLGVEDEAMVIRSSRQYLEKLFQCTVNIEENNPGKGGKVAWPGRPVISLARQQ